MRPCRNPQCEQLFSPVSSIHSFCSDHCRRAVRGSEYRKAREVALYRDEYACTECGSGEKLECHHILPLCQGGDNSLDNLQTLCHKHHKAKHKSWKEATIANEYKAGNRESEVYDYAA